MHGPATPRTIVVLLVAAGLQPCITSVAAGLQPGITSVAAGLQPRSSATHRRDLSIDESRGGHTLARHVGRTDEQLRQRLRSQPNISAASTYPDRPTAELIVATLLDAEASRIRSWARRTGSRPNLALRTRTPRGPPTGRVLERGAKTPVEAHHAVVVLRWDTAANTYFVLTSYPENR